MSNPGPLNKILTIYLFEEEFQFYYNICEQTYKTYIWILPFEF